MAEEDSTAPFKVPDEVQLNTHIDVYLLRGMMTLLIANVAAQGRKPPEAAEYVVEFGNEIRRFIDFLNPTDEPIDLIYKERMLSTLNSIINDISFEDSSE